MGTKHLTEADRFRARTLFFDAGLPKARIREITGFSMNQVKLAIREKTPKPRTGRPPRRRLQQQQQQQSAEAGISSPAAATAPAAPAYGNGLTTAAVAPKMTATTAAAAIDFVPTLSGGIRKHSRSWEITLAPSSGFPEWPQVVSPPPISAASAAAAAAAADSRFPEGAAPLPRLSTDGPMAGSFKPAILLSPPPAPPSVSAPPTGGFSVPSLIISPTPQWATNQ